MSAMSIKNLTKKYKDIIAVDDISFEIPHGEITALLGANGAGKSTTLNIIAGILDPSAGEVTFSNMSYKKNYKEIKSKIGYLTSDMSLYKDFSIYENLMILSELRGFKKQDAKRKIDELSQYLNFKEVLSKNFNEISSGQKQRALIASSILHDPEILIFDEVTASLDIVISKSIMDFLIFEKKKGKAIIFATHILSEVEYISDRILMLERGILIRDTTFCELINESKSMTMTETFCNIFAGEKIAA